MIKIEKPIINETDDKVIVECLVKIDNDEKNLFFETNKEYKQYLCTERSDAFVIGAIYFAMKYNHDIYCDIPISSSLFHNITTFLIPTLSKHSNILKSIKLYIPISEDLQTNAKAVGTGISCGVDSMYVLNKYLNPEIEEYKITHLCFNNVGAFDTYAEKYHGKGSKKVKDEMYKKILQLQKQLNLPLIVNSSNIGDVFHDEYFKIHTFYNVFVVFMLQKLFGKYYYGSSGYDLSKFDVIDEPRKDSSEYELLLFFAFQTKDLKIYSEGMEKTRLEKTIAIADMELARHNLHVCIIDSKNCNTCMKCRRTLLMLDAINKLDNFSEVFDIDYYKKNIDEYYKWLNEEYEKDSKMNVPTYLLLKQKSSDFLYKNIDLFNEKNVIIPNMTSETVMITKDNLPILEKNDSQDFDSYIYNLLLVSYELANKDNLELKIPFRLLDDVFKQLKRKKGLKSKIKYVLSRRKTTIKTHDLIYFILFSPKAGKKICNYLIKHKYVIIEKKNKISCFEILDLFNKISENKLLVEIINTKKVRIKKKNLFNQNKMINKESFFYVAGYDLSIRFLNKKKYYFIGKANNYSVAIASSIKDKKLEDVFNDLAIAIDLIYKTND